MIKQLKVRFAAILLLSVIIYGIPFHLGGFGLRFFLAVVIMIILTELVKLLWKLENKSSRNYVLIGLFNSIVLFHLALIYSYLTFTATTTLVVGLVVGALLYFVIINRMEKVI